MPETWDDQKIIKYLTEDVANSNKFGMNKDGIYGLVTAPTLPQGRRNITFKELLSIEASLVSFQSNYMTSISGEDFNKGDVVQERPKGHTTQLKENQK